MSIHFDKRRHGSQHLRFFKESHVSTQTRSELYLTSAKKQRAIQDSPLVHLVVARTRFELVISALRGRRPEPLDERANVHNKHLAGMEGVEPPLTEPESAVLPLDDIPKHASLCATREK